MIETRSRGNRRHRCCPLYFPRRHRLLEEVVFEGGWTRVQGIGSSEILRRIEFSPPPPQRLGGQQLVNRLEAWWVQVRRIADGWMGGNSSGSQRQERPRANCCPESFSSLCFVSLLLSSCLLKHFPKHIPHSNPTLQGPSGLPYSSID